MLSLPTIDVADTLLPADSVEFCPHDDARDILVCGTYNLIKSDEEDFSSTDRKQTQIRNGQCLVYKINRDPHRIEKVQQIDTAAILDLKWSYDCNEDSGRPVLALAESVGNIRFYEWDQQNKSLDATQVVQVAEPHVLCLSIDWNNRVLSQGNQSLVVSKSDGALSVLKPNQARMEIDMTWHAHDFEPWTAAWNYWTPYVIYSGGDDCKLKGWDIRASCDTPTFINKRFEAGVTCIQAHPFVEHLVAVGSYDNEVRLFDSRNMIAPVANVGVGGGVWRIKWHPSPSRKNDLLVACMHDGFKVIKCSAGDSIAPILTSPPSIESRYDAHSSLAYGADWQYSALQEELTKSIIASCSFYDHSLHLWLS